MFNLFNQNSSKPEAQSAMQARAIEKVDSLTENLPPMVSVLLNTYLPQLWANLSDENILLMVQHVREVIDYIEHGEREEVNAIGEVTE